MPDKEHSAKTVDCVTCAIVTVSDTRTVETDRSGALIRQRLESAGHRVVGYEIIPDDPARVRDRVVAFCEDGSTEAVLLTGGTGLTPRDTTFGAVTTILEKQLDGFGELFRMLSYDEIGAAAMLSRAVGGVRRGTVVFSMPGSMGAVELALDKLILPQLGHIAALLRG